MVNVVGDIIVGDHTVTSNVGIEGAYLLFFVGGRDAVARNFRFDITGYDVEARASDWGGRVRVVAHFVDCGALSFAVAFGNFSDFSRYWFGAVVFRVLARRF